MAELAPHYKLMGIDVSPYTMKVLSYLKYKGVSWEWFPRNLRTEKIFRQHAQVQLIPMLFLPDGSTMQDSTPIIEYLEAEHPEPSIYPDDPALRFLAALLEEFGDEWCNKLMFFQRWFAKADQIATGERIAGAMLEGQWFRPVAKPILAKFIVRRMIPRLSFAGANETNIPHLQRSFESVVAKLDTHLATRPYLLGGRPSFGDFGIWGNIYQAWTDPTAGSYMNKNARHLVAWIERMLAPDDEGPFETLEALAPTLRPLLKTDIAERFLKWSAANDKAWKAGRKQTSLEMGGASYEQKTFKYHSVSLGELRKKYETGEDDTELNTLLEETGCLQYLDA